MALAELSDLYSERILQIAGNPPHAPRLAQPHGSATKTSRVCGSRIAVDVAVEDGVITAYGHEVSACALGQTAAAIVAREIVGTQVDEFFTLKAWFERMITAEGEAPEGRWADLGYLLPVRDYPHRHGSTLLVFEALAEALEQAGQA